MAIEPTLIGLLLATGTTMYWLKQPVGLCDDWLQGTPSTQMLIEPGYIAVFVQPDGCVAVVYSPTTCSHSPAWSSPHVGCQSAPEPRPALGLKTYADSRLQRL